ncbi:MAG: type II toxin-antitoxin system HicA family toxin [Candidatus Acidiferrales bacterium]
MGADVPVIKPRQILRALLRAGFVINHQSGSHAQLRHPLKPHLRVTVPRHDRFDLPGLFSGASFGRPS